MARTVVITAQTVVIFHSSFLKSVLQLSHHSLCFLDFPSQNINPAPLRFPFPPSPFVTIQPPIFTTHYTKIAILLFTTIHINYIVSVTSSLPPDFPQNKTPPSLIFFSPFRCNFNSIVTNIIYIISLCLISSIKAEPHYPPEAIRHQSLP